MILQRVYSKIISRNIRKYSSKVRPKVEVNSAVQSDIESGEYKPRKHPGIFKPRTINLPQEFVSATEKAIADYPVKQIIDESASLVNYMKSRHPPIEHNALRKKKKEIEQRALSEKANIEELSAEEVETLKEKMKKRIDSLMFSQVYAWKPIEYDMYTSLKYLIARSCAEYAALVRIFQEISARDPEFKPKTFFDFGSGVGTGTWAANLFWRNSLFEYFCVDSSVHMNDLAQILLKGGSGASDASTKGVFYRQFLPATNTSYDLVMSAYSLFELPSLSSRLQTVLKLWNKTQKYLVLVEIGSNAGFKLINEARDFILNINNENNQGHIFSPCPHDSICPRFLSDTTPCNFPISYMTMPVGQKSTRHTETFCYVVLKKGRRDGEATTWPRIVRPTLVRSKHAICRMCMASGKLDEIIFTQSKHGRVVYRCAKVSEWGDLVPITIHETT